MIEASLLLTPLPTRARSALGSRLAELRRRAGSWWNGALPGGSGGELLGLGRVRRIFWMFAVMAGLILVGDLDHQRLSLGLAALGVLLGGWTLGYLRGRFPLWWLPIEGVALLAAAHSFADPERAILLFYAGLVFRALYGRWPRVAAVTAVYLGVQVAEYLLSGHGGEFHLVVDFGGFVLTAAALSQVAQRVAERDELLEERRELTERLRRRTLEDPLTGVANRRSFEDRLVALREAAGPEGSRLGILALDLDDFKRINDHLGHRAGDDLLQRVAARLAGCLRAGELLARYGGDEFLVLLEGVDEAAAVTVARRLLASLATPFDADGHSVKVGASLGVAVNGTTDADELLRRADGAMYEAKKTGKGSFRVAAGRRRKTGDLDLVGELRQAIADDGLSVAYQPLIDLKTGRVSGFEALVRWEHPRLGPLSPAHFIPVAEDSGLIVDLDRAVLRRSCRDLAELHRTWSEGPLPGVNVNLSALNLVREDLVDSISRALQAADLPAAFLTLELTESQLALWSEPVLERLTRLRALGVHLAIDDFGSGYAAFGYLRQAPIDVLKIDRSFIDGMARSKRDDALVQTILQVARILRVTTIGEGIETPEQRDRLAALGCDVGQGFLFSRPLGVEAVLRLYGGVAEPPRGERLRAAAAGR